MLNPLLWIAWCCLVFFMSVRPSVTRFMPLTRAHSWPSSSHHSRTRADRRLLAVLFDSGRAVINDNQLLFDDRTKKDKHFSPEVFERQLADMFRGRSGADLQELDAARMPANAKQLLKQLVAVSKTVVAQAQPELDRLDVGFKGFIPAVFGERVATRFTARTGVRLKQTALVPRNPANAPDPFERTALEAFAEPSYPREKNISEVTAKGQAVRLMFPLYTTRHCLDCHGEPKGVLDQPVTLARV